MRDRLFVVVVAMGLLFQSGCAVALIGAGAVAGYSLSKDSIEGYTDVPYDALWHKAIEVIREEGVVTMEDKEHGKIEGLVKEVNITLNMTKVTETSIKLKITGRKYLLPSVVVPQDLFIRIIEGAGGKVNK
ncbi:MAG: hypothetical protein P9M13_01180 [Candidatus Ancaeobacter aquaticus]|nr:hypothetical protein [Candidatus Ancaeobacter aquaticus]